jgi:hypothetical protein
MQFKRLVLRKRQANTACTGQVRAFAHTFGSAAPKADSAFGGFVRQFPPLPVTPAVETVEKVPFRKLIFGKWDKNLEKRLVFWVPNTILAIFEPVVGDFCEDFPSKEFFDSLVGRLTPKLRQTGS